MENKIELNLNCKFCIQELPAGESAQSYARLDVGLTADGLQVWCVRHNLSVAYITDLDELHRNAVLMGCGICQLPMSEKPHVH